MNLPARRKPIALLFCYGFASVLAGGHVTEAHAQASAPLRVDPALLGLPPVTPAEAPAPATKVTPVEIAPVEASTVEARPVDAPAVEPAPEHEVKLRKIKPKTPDAPKASAQEIPSRAVAPQSAPPLVESSPEPEPKQVVVPAIVPPARKPREDERQVEPLAQPVQPAKPAEPASQLVSPKKSTPAATTSAAIAPGATVSALGSLRVDPALLGLPTATEQIAPRPAAAAAVATVRSSRNEPLVLASSSAAGSRAQTTAPRVAAADKSWPHRLWDPVADAYNFGDWEFYLPLHTHHLRSKYTAEKIATYQESPLGFGVGRGGYNEKGNWEGVYAMAFQDSHFKPMYTAGYGWKAVWHPAEDVRLGLGYTAGLMSRTDIFGYVPFPIILPMASLAYKNFSLEGTFVPGGEGNGNIFFIWAKWELGKQGEAIGTPARPVELPAPTQLATSLEQRLPYGPALGDAAQLASSAETRSPRLPAAGDRDQAEVPDAGPSLALRMSSAMQPQSKDSAVPQPVFLSAQRMGGEIDREFVAEGDAELRKVGTVVNSERLTYWPIDDEVEAEGDVRLEQGYDLITGPKMRLKLEEQVGYFEQPSYLLKRGPVSGKRVAAGGMSVAGQPTGSGDWSSGFAGPQAQLADGGLASAGSESSMTIGRGVADRLDFEGENQVRMTNGTYTTCAPGNDDWYARIESLKLDYDREVGEGTDGTVFFKDVPIFYSPWLSFSLNRERKSGFLAPTFGTNSDSGAELSIPYYWNIAPNTDATITPRVMSKRGVQLDNEFRYLNTAYGGLYNGSVRAEFLPSDALRDGENRYGISLLHNQDFTNGFSGLVNFNKVSDDDYFTDLSSRVSNTAQTQLLQQGQLSYGGGWWSATANFQQYQTLQPDAEDPVLEPYKLLPQITVNARQPDFYSTDSSFLGQYTQFTRNDQTISGNFYDGLDGQRTVLYPQIAMPYVTPGWYITPKLGVNVRHYAISGQATAIPDSISVTLPIVSVDSGMTFERPSNWFGQDYTQTLEPRLYYLNIPYKDQSAIPLFDTGLADFNFAQIFSENQFSGWDRISNANQLTAAATTRLLEPNTGNEVIRAMFGQRFYFSQNTVGLNSVTSSSEDNSWEKSDFLAAFSGQVLPRVYTDFAWQYNPTDRQVKRYSMGARYQPEPGKVLNASYRYNRDFSAPIDQVDFSGQWPLSGRWHAVGRLNYSFKDDGTVLATGSQGGRVIESIAGLEYNGGCWVVRGVIQRSALTQEDASTAFFVQLELNDFSSIGSNPLSLLKRNIQGYSVINQSVADPVLGE